MFQNLNPCNFQQEKDVLHLNTTDNEHDFSLNYENVSLWVPRNSDSWSFSMLRVLEQAFIVFHGDGNDVGIWLDGTPGHIECGFFSQDFPSIFVFSKCDCQCIAQTIASLPTLKLALSLNHFYFIVSSFGKQYTDILSLFDSSKEQFVLHV